MAFTVDDEPNAEDGEPIDIVHRVVVSPVAGVFRPLASLDIGHHVAAGAAIGKICTLAGDVTVESSFTGVLRQWFAASDERLLRFDRIASIEARQGL